MKLKDAFGVLFFSGFFSILILSAEMSPAQTPNDLPNFHQVVIGHLYRGGQPSPAGVKILSEKGIKTVIDLRVESPFQSRQEQKLVEGLGMKYINVPMNPLLTPSDQVVAYLEDTLLGNPALFPVFIHCHYGEDRTGLIVGLHRVFREAPAFTPAQAYAEMLQYGFHPTLKNLANYYFTKASWHPFLGVAAF